MNEGVSWRYLKDDSTVLFVALKKGSSVQYDFVSDKRFYTTNQVFSNNVILYFSLSTVSSNIAMKSCKIFATNKKELEKREI